MSKRTSNWTANWASTWTSDWASHRTSDWMVRKREAFTETHLQFLIQIYEWYILWSWQRQVEKCISRYFCENKYTLRCLASRNPKPLQEFWIAIVENILTYFCTHGSQRFKAGIYSPYSVSVSDSISGDPEVSITNLAYWIVPGHTQRW